MDCRKDVRPFEGMGNRSAFGNDKRRLAKAPCPLTTLMRPNGLCCRFRKAGLHARVSVITGLLAGTWPIVHGIGWLARYRPVWQTGKAYTMNRSICVPLPVRYEHG